MTDPLRVILANDAELIIEGLKGLLAPYSDRIEIVGTATGDPQIEHEAIVDADADIMLIDAFGRTGAGMDAMGPQGLVVVTAVILAGYAGFAFRRIRKVPEPSIEGSSSSS